MTLRMRFNGFISPEEANELQKTVGEEIAEKFKVKIR
jgi:hypothetical protein